MVAVSHFLTHSRSLTSSFPAATQAARTVNARRQTVCGAFEAGRETVVFEPELNTILHQRIAAVRRQVQVERNMDTIFDDRMSSRPEVPNSESSEKPFEVHDWHEKAWEALRQAEDFNDEPEF